MLSGFAKVKPGAGPRHLAFHPNGKFVYVLSEMDSSVTVFSYQAKNGAFTSLQTISTLPKDYSGRKGSRRDCRASFRKISLHLEPRPRSASRFSQSTPRRERSNLFGQVLTGGKTPRHFAIDPTGPFLFAENQESNNIVVFHIDSATGNLTPTGQTVDVPSPVCITFVAAQ